MRLAKPPAIAPMDAAGDMSASSRNAISIPAAAPIVAERATTVTSATIMISAGPIFMVLPSEKCSYTRDQGLPSPFDKSERRLDSIIQLIMRNVKRIFIQGYILQIAVLIAASGAFGDQIK